MAPVVLIHGLFGWGEDRPLFGLGPTYFPLQHLRKLWPHGPVVAVDVGAASSDHDRACEAFAQLLGQRTDYGEAHAHECEHVQHGTIYEIGLLEDWSASNPIHIIGHSFGGNTAVMLFNLIAEDFWKQGTGPEWVISVTCICSPLRGCSLPSVIGLEPPTDAGTGGQHGDHQCGLACKAAVTLFHLFVKLQQQWPLLLRPFFDVRMDQWRAHQHSLRESQRMFWNTGDNMLSQTSSQLRGDTEIMGSHFRNLYKTRLIAVVAGSLDPLSPYTVMRSVFAPIIGLTTGGSLLGLVALWRARTRLRDRLHRVPPGVLRRLVLLLLAWSAVSPMVVVTALYSRRLQRQRAAIGAWLQECILEPLRPLLHGWLMRPLLRLSSYALRHHHGTMLVPTGNAAVMNIGEDNDGMINLISQYGLDAPTVENVTVLPSTRTRAKLRELAGGGGGSGSAAAAVDAGRPGNSRPRVQSAPAVADRDALDARPLSVGKWHVIHVPTADHCLGTWLDPHHTRDMYTELFFLLQNCSPLRRPSSLRDLP